MANTAEVVIIGGGIIGCAAAYYLAKRGSSVLVLEKEEGVGFGGSSRNGGGVRQSGRDPRELPLAMYSIRNIWPGLSEELGVDVEYCQGGNLRLGKNEDQARILRGLTERALACGLDLRMISGDEAREINPHLSKVVTAASWCPTDGHANPLRATLGFYRKARELGVRFICGQEVRNIKKIRGRARLAETAAAVYEGETIILAAGYESRIIGETLGIDVPMLPLLLEALVTEGMAPLFPQMMGTALADFYGHQSAHGSFVFGIDSGYEEFAKPGPPVCSSTAASMACRSITGYFPCLRDLKIIRSWAGWIDTCADNIPVISFVDEVPGLILACGFTGHGFGIAPAVGLFLSEMALDGKASLDLSALTYDRFKPPG
ncbi:MAG: FAD-binding oxidoreductase [Treponema sp.]|jgi:sarcosine oxidase subunit beta|nr:FAD-binding oxidoreductase [Treponema sp.]